MKKLLALILAGIMMFALAAPAYADVIVDYVTIGINAPEAGQTIASANADLSVEVLDFGGNSQPGGASLNLNLTKWQIKSGEEWADYTGDTFTAGKTYRAKVAIEKQSGYTYDYTIYRFKYLPDTNTVQTSPSFESNTVYMFSNSFAVEENLTPVTSIKLNINAVYGQKVYAENISVVDDPANSVQITKIYWEKYPTGTDPDESENITDPDEVFQKGYGYYLNLNIEGKPGYEIDDNVKVYLNGEEEYVDPYDGVIKSNFKVVPTEAKEETTTAATTVKAGDTLSITFYLVALIVLAAGAGVTFFATKRR